MSTKPNSLERLIDGYAAADEVVGLMCSLGTMRPEDAEQKRKAWARTRQGKRFLAGKEAIPDVSNIAHGIGYHTRVMAVDAALVEFNKHRPLYLKQARELKGRGYFLMQVGSDDWTLVWNHEHREFREMYMEETSTRPGGLEYGFRITVRIPPELR
jgi:hypothetical protein